MKHRKDIEKINKWRFFPILNEPGSVIDIATIAGCFVIVAVRNHRSIDTTINKKKSSMIKNVKIQNTLYFLGINDHKWCIGCGYLTRNNINSFETYIYCHLFLSPLSLTKHFYFKYIKDLTKPLSYESYILIVIPYYPKLSKHMQMVF